MTTQELHNRSILLGNKYAELYAAPLRTNEDYMALDEALDAYIASRRELKPDPYTGRRFGSMRAYQATQGFNLENWPKFLARSGLGPLRGPPNGLNSCSTDTCITWTFYWEYLGCLAEDAIMVVRKYNG